MTFSEIANLLYPHCGQGQNHADFVVNLIDKIMEDPTNGDIEGDYNPIMNLVSRTREKYFNGDLQIGRKNASRIRGHLDKEKFETFIETFSNDALLAITVSLTQKGITTTALNVPTKCAELMEKALGGKIEKLPFKNKVSVETAEELIPAVSTKTRFIQLKAIIPPEEVSEQEIPYVTELLEAYGEAEGIGNFTKEILKKYANTYGEHFKRQRKDFYAAESVRQGTRETYGETDPDQFEVLKEETYDGIVDVWEQNHLNGYVRLNKVLTQASQIRIDRCWICRDTDWIGNSQKKGVCHILVNDGRIRGWVKNDE